MTLGLTGVPARAGAERPAAHHAAARRLAAFCAVGGGRAVGGEDPRWSPPPGRLAYGQVASVDGRRLVLRNLDGRLETFAMAPNRCTGEYDLRGDWVGVAYVPGRHGARLVGADFSAVPFYLGRFATVTGEVVRTAGRLVVLRTASGTTIRLYEGPYRVRLAVGETATVDFTAISHVLMSQTAYRHG